MKWNWESKIIAGFMCLYLVYNIFEGTAGIPILFVLVFVVAPWMWNRIKKTQSRINCEEG